VIASIAAAISAVRDAGYQLESNGEGGWRIGGSRWVASSVLIQLAALIRDRPRLLQ